MACIFHSKYGCNKRNACQTNRDRDRIAQIKLISKQRGDSIHAILVDCESQQTAINYHKTCVSRYQLNSDTPMKTEPCKSPKKKRSSADFAFQEHCIFCGEKCEITKDAKNPNRWRHAYRGRSTVSASDSKSFGAYLLETCDARDDNWGDDVKVRLQGAVSDLNAAGEDIIKTVTLDLSQERFQEI